MIRSTGRIKIYKHVSSLEIALPYLKEDFTTLADMKEGVETWEVMKNEERTEGK